MTIKCQMQGCVAETWSGRCVQQPLRRCTIADVRNYQERTVRRERTNGMDLRLPHNFGCVWVADLSRIGGGEGGVGVPSLAADSEPHSDVLQHPAFAGSLFVLSQKTLAALVDSRRVRTSVGCAADTVPCQSVPGRVPVGFVIGSQEGAHGPVVQVGFVEGHGIVGLVHQFGIEGSDPQMALGELDGVPILHHFSGRKNESIGVERSLRGGVILGGGESERSKREGGDSEKKMVGGHWIGRRKVERCDELGHNSASEKTYDMRFRDETGSGFQLLLSVIRSYRSMQHVTIDR